MPKAWSAWSFWQHTDKGKVPGVGGACDLDYFHGGEAQLKLLTVPCGGDAGKASPGHPKNSKSPRVGAIRSLSRVLRAEYGPFGGPMSQGSQAA